MSNPISFYYELIYLFTFTGNNNEFNYFRNELLKKKKADFGKITVTSI